MNSRFVTALERALSRACSGQKRQFSAFSGPSRIWLGFQTRHPGDGYAWHGLRRKVNQPEVLFQFTLRGEGLLRIGETTTSVRAGQAFLVTIPSDHEYRIPDRGESWTFFWIIADHPYVVERLGGVIRRSGPILELSKGSLGLEASRRLFLETIQEAFVDATEQERALLNWMLDLERHCGQSEQNDGDDFLKKFESIVKQRMSRSFGVDEIAAQWGMSRSHFSHYFRKRTGCSPAEVIRSLRLDEALRLLANPELSISEIAKKVGFGSSTHLCKVCRKSWGMPPGHLRQQRYGLK
ncbi:MAG: helix-turn-helix domain-containing protein [Verrucomicrobiales bacterium]